MWALQKNWESVSHKLQNFTKITGQEKLLCEDIFHRWQFKSPPPLNGGANSCVVAVRNDQILGVMGLNRKMFYLDTKMRIGAELTTWGVVDQKTKGSELVQKY